MELAIRRLDESENGMQKALQGMRFEDGKSFQRQDKTAIGNKNGKASQAFTY